MVSVFVKAAVIVLMVFLANVLIVKSIEDQREFDIQTKLNEIEKDSQISRLLLLYMETLDADQKISICPALDKQANDQIVKANQLAYSIDRYREANLIKNLKEAREKYILQDAELWLYLKQLEKLCGIHKVIPILYFYPEKTACLECQAQAEILNSYRDQCKNVRVFAFPANRESGIIQVLTARYNVTKTPSLVIKDITYEGIIPQSTLKEHVECAK
ncbi:hypothetical protein HY989_06800 [Candidatus Micrarchaeota archaeon]|nr:hypothetical protein [Candidatus Micrarchaeota archaeon]